MSKTQDRATGPRCIALVGPFGAGKTTLLEAILARTGAISRQGRVDDGSTVGDASPLARDHVMSVEANIATCSYMGEDFTFVDCPGSVEFLASSAGVLSGVDAAIVVVEADPRKMPALQMVLKQLEDLKVPHMLFLNKVDRAETHVRETLKVLQEASRVPLVLREIPIRKNDIVTGYIDLALERAYIYREHAPSTVIELSGDDKAAEVSARYSMLEALADYDDELMEQLLEDIEPPADLVFDDLAEELRQGQIVPVFFGAADKGNGVSRLLKALRHEAPDVHQTAERLGVTINEKTILQVLNTRYTQHAGKMSFARVLSGTVADGQEVVTSAGQVARISGLFSVFGGAVKKRGTAGLGECLALGKVEHAATGDTLVGDKADQCRLVTLPDFPPVMARSIAVTEHKDEVKLSAALHKLQDEDPSLHLTLHPEMGAMNLEGQGEMHLRVAMEALRDVYGLSIESGAPKVAYKETIQVPVTQRGRHKKQSGGHGQYGDVVLDIKPMPRGEGFVFGDTITGGVVPKQYIPAVENGVKEALVKGPLGFPVVDLSATLTEGSHHAVDSSEQAFRAAGRLAMSEALPQAKPVLLEPIAKVRLVMPNDATPKINALIAQRRGQILGFDARDGWAGWDEVEALMPEADIQDLIIELRSLTAGVATFTKAFDHLQEVNGKQAEQVLKDAQMA